MIALFLIGCGGGATTAEKHDDHDDHAEHVEAKKELTEMEKAVMVAKAIDADASKADEALKEAGLTEEEYRKLLFQIAKDPAQAEEFASKR